MAKNDVVIKIDYGKKRLEENRRKIDNVDRKASLSRHELETKIDRVHSSLDVSNSSLSNASRILAQEIGRVDEDQSSRLVYRGQWNRLSDYSPGDLVRYEGHNWVSIKASRDQTPLMGSIYWDFAGSNARNLITTGGGGGTGDVAKVAGTKNGTAPLIPSSGSPPGTAELGYSSQVITFARNKNQAVYASYILPDLYDYEAPSAGITITLYLMVASTGSGNGDIYLNTTVNILGDGDNASEVGQQYLNVVPIVDTLGLVSSVVFPYTLAVNTDRGDVLSIRIERDANNVLDTYNDLIGLIPSLEVALDG